MYYISSIIPSWADPLPAGKKERMSEEENKVIEQLIKQYISDHLNLWVGKDGDYVSVEISLDGDVIARDGISIA